MSDQKENKYLLVSYLSLRRIIGILGIALPIVCAAGCFIAGSCKGLEPSISHYYGTDTRNLFVGILCTVSCFLYTYRGYESIDNIMGNIACIFGLGVAFFPTTSLSPVIHAVHVICAAGMFLTLAFFSIFIFTKSDVDPTPQKKSRNKVYVSCGYAIIIFLILITVCNLFLRDTAVWSIRPVFWLESLVLWAFGISWIVKGEMILKDI
jgi:hypothetical protein